MRNKLKVICVSGSVGSGKTTIAKKIAKLLKFEYVDIKKLISLNKKIVCGFDKKRDTFEVDTIKLNKVLIELIKDCSCDKKIKGLVIDSHLSHYLDAKYVDVCVICECSDLKKLKNRLKKRGYSQLKIDENIETEILEVCLVESLEEKHNVVLIGTDKKVDYGKIKKELLHCIK